MTPLSLELFAGAVHDVERTQYQILGGLKHARQAFASNRVYPHLGRLVKLHQALQTVMEQSEAFRNPRSGRIREIDLENRTIRYAWPDLDGDQMSIVQELIQWALPHIQGAIEEGRAVYEFVEENLEVEEVGIVPSYVHEGYMLIPDREEEALHVLRYTLSIFDNDDESYRTLKTVHCESIAHGTIEVHPSSVKLRLMEERRDLPNPATYFFNTDLTFPYEDTLLPIVKRRMMRHLATEIGRA